MRSSLGQPEARRDGAAALLQDQSAREMCQLEQPAPPEGVVAEGASASSACATSPEEAACLLGRMLFTWAFPVLWGGYRRGRVDLTDLPPLPAADQPDVLSAHLCAAWRQQQQQAASNRRLTSLAWMLFGLSAGLFAQVLVFQFIMVIAQYLQPILLHELLLQLQMGGDQGTILASAVGIASMVMVQWIFAEYGWIQMVKCDLRLQAGMNHMVFRKSLYLPATGSGYSLGRLQNVFATDCTKPPSAFLHSAMFTILDAFISLLVVTWHLIALIGSAGFVGMAVVFALSPVSWMLKQHVQKFVSKRQESRDARGRLFNQFLSAMRVVKCFCLEEVAWQQIGDARREELKWQWRLRCIFPFNNFIGASASLFATAASFTWLVLVLGKTLDPAIAFTVLSWNNLLKSKIIGLPNACVTILDILVSIRRVEELLRVELGDGGFWLHSALQPESDLGGIGALASAARGSLEACGASKEHTLVGTDFELVDCDFGFPLPDSVGGHQGVHGITLSVKPGELLLVCGAIGSGKSTLLQGLAGTIPPLRGNRLSQGRSVAYVAQRPWLLNGTLLENVLFGRACDAPLLERALDSCALGADLSVLSDGLHTLVGEEGVQLSGGQKQRVSLARAIYNEADVILMDDVLSALDAHVGRHVWDTAICKALHGRTRVLVTHQVQYASDPAVHRILLLDDIGRVQHLGTYRELCDRGVSFGALRRQLSGDEEAHQGEMRGSDSTIGNGQSAGNSITSASLRAHSPTSGNVQPSPSVGAHAEHRRLGAVQCRDLVDYLRACGGVYGVGTIVLIMLAYYGTQFAASFELAAWANLNSYESGKGEAVPEAVSKAYLEGYLLLSFGTGATCLLFFLGIQLVSLRSSRVLHESFTQSLLWTELRFFDLAPTGRILNRALKDFQMVDDRLPAAFRELIESLMNFVQSIAILFLFAWESMLVVPFFAVIYWKLMNVYRWPARDLKRLESTSRSPMMSHFADTTRGSGTIRAYRHDVRFMRQNLELMGNVQRTSYWFWTAQGWVSMVQEVLGTFLLAIIAGTIGYRASTGVLSPGLAGLALSYAINMPRDLMWLSRCIASLEVELVSIERVLEYIRLLPEEDAHAAVHITSGGDWGPQHGQRGHAISFHDVWFRYAAELPWILQGITVEVPVGVRAAVVGRTGCGKSSFLSALARLYPASSGRLLVHGHDVMRMRLHELRSIVRVLLQDPIFFSGSIRSNLVCRILDEPSARQAGQRGHSDQQEDSALWRALAQAGLERLVQELPGGLDELVEEGGQNFSHGQRQLLCLARVLVEPCAADACHEGIEVASSASPPRILLCDEPTSACDLATDEAIHETLLRGLPAAWTLVVVCHRLHRIREFDAVYVLDSGRVVEEGSPGSLLDAAAGGPCPSGALASMCRQQAVL